MGTRRLARRIQWTCALVLVAVVLIRPARSQVFAQEAFHLEGMEAVRFLYNMGQYSEVRKACPLLLWEDIRQPEALYYMARALDHLGLVDEAAVWYHLTERQLAELPPNQLAGSAAAVLQECQARLRLLDTAHRTAAEQHLKVAPGRLFTSPLLVDDLWMSQVEADWAPLHGLYLWTAIGGRKDLPATWIHNAQGVMHRSGAKHMAEVDGRKGVLFCVSRKEAPSRLRFRNTVRGSEVRMGVQAYNWPLDLRVTADGEVVFSARIEANVWTDLNAPLGAYAERDVPCVVELTVPEGQEPHEGAFFDYVDVFSGQGPGVPAPLPAAATAGPAPLDPALGKGLVGHWRFEEGAGFDVGDASGGGHGGMLKVASRTSPWVAACTAVEGNHALSFDGRSTCVEVPDDGGLASPDALTVACWVKLARIKQYRANHTFVGKWGPGADGVGESFAFWMDHQDFDELCLWVSAGPWSTRAGTQISSTTNARMTAGEWCHVAVVWEANKAPIFYKSGLPLESHQKGGPYKATLPRMQTTSTPIKLGQGDRNPPGGIHRLDGALDDVRLYNRALSPDEIAALADIPAAPDRP